MPLMNQRVQHARRYTSRPVLRCRRPPPGYVMEVAEPTSTPNPAAFPRVDVTGNDNADRPALPDPPLAQDGCEKKSSHRAKRPIGMPPAATLPLVALIVAPLSVNPNVIGNANAAPRHEHRRAARERAGIRHALSRTPDRRTLRRRSGRIMYEHYATFSFPAHTRVASRPKSPARILTTLFDLPATLRAETEPFCSPGAARGVGLIGEVNPVGCANVAVPGPLPSVAPCGKP